MKKETFAEKLARKSFESAGVQRSWKVHVQAFGPILEPAFAEDFQTRIHLINALNHISNRDLKTGLKKLQLIEKACETDADRQRDHRQGGDRVFRSPHGTGISLGIQTPRRRQIHRHIADHCCKK